MILWHPLATLMIYLFLHVPILRFFLCLPVFWSEIKKVEEVEIRWKQRG